MPSEVPRERLGDIITNIDRVRAHLHSVAPGTDLDDKTRDAVERCLEISGPDGFKFAQLMTPRDLSKCAVGQAKYVLVVDSDGGIINDPVLTRMDENTFWFALASSGSWCYKAPKAWTGRRWLLRHKDSSFWLLR